MTPAQRHLAIVPLSHSLSLHLSGKLPPCCHRARLGFAASLAAATVDREDVPWIYCCILRRLRSWLFCSSVVTLAFCPSNRPLTNTPRPAFKVTGGGVTPWSRSPSPSNGLSTLYTIGANLVCSVIKLQLQSSEHQLSAFVQAACKGRWV